MCHLYTTLCMYVCVLQGQGIHNTSVVHGMVFKRYVEGDVTKASGCKVAVFSCPLDLMQTETKVTVHAYTHTL